MIFDFLTDFWKIFNLQFRTKRSIESRVVPCGQTDRRKDRRDETNSRFSQFCERA
jgi:hypothetical protein